MKGFSLLEVLLVTGIIIVISSTVLAGFNKFIQNLNLTNVSQEIASNLRRVEGYAMAVRAFNDPSNGIVYPPYGLNFDILKPDEFIVFANIDGPDSCSVSPCATKNEIYDDPGAGTPADGLVETFRLSKARITELCLNYKDISQDCSIATLDVVYKRPDPSIYITGNGTDAATNAAVKINFAGKEYAIVFWISGQIYVDQI